MSERIEGGCVNVGKIFIKKVSETVEQEIEKMIESGKFQSGEKLPSVRELCDLFGVGRSAVRDAITTLKGKGTVYVKQGEGTYICEFDSTKLFTNHMLIPARRHKRLISSQENIGDRYCGNGCFQSVGTRFGTYGRNPFKPLYQWLGRGLPLSYGDC